MGKVGAYIVSLLVLIFLATPAWGLSFFCVTEFMDMMPLEENVEILDAIRFNDEGIFKYDCKIKYTYNNKIYESNLEIYEDCLENEEIKLFIYKSRPSEVCTEDDYNMLRYSSYFLLGLSAIFLILALKTILEIIFGIFGFSFGRKMKCYHCIIEEFYYSEKYSCDVLKCKGSMYDSLEERVFEVPYNYEYEILDTNLFLGEWLDVYVNDKKNIVFGDFEKFFKELHSKDFKSIFKIF